VLVVAHFECTGITSGNVLLAHFEKHILKRVGAQNMLDPGKVSPTFPVALLSVDARFERKIQKPQTGIK